MLHGRLRALAHESVEHGEGRVCLALPALGFGESLPVLPLGDGWNETPVGVDGLERAIFGRDVVGQRAHHGAAWHGYGLLPPRELRRVRSGDVAHGRTLHVALDARELAGEKQGFVAEMLPYAHARLEHVVGGQIRVAVHDAHACEVGVFEAGDGTEDATLLAPLQACLEAHDVVQAALCVVLAQLHHGVGDLARAGVRKAHRLHRTEAQGVLAAAGYGLHGEAALEVQILFEVLYGAKFGGRHVIYEGVVLLLGHRAVQVGGLALVVAGGAIDHRLVQRVAVDDGRSRFVEVEPLPREILYLFGQRVRGQGAGRDHGRTVGDLGRLPTDDIYVRVGVHRIRHGTGEVLAGHPQGTASRHGVGVRAGQDHRAQPPQLLLQ